MEPSLSRMFLLWLGLVILVLTTSAVTNDAVTANRRSFDTLVGLFNTSEDHHTRAKAALAISKYDYPERADILIEALENQEDSSLKRWIVLGLSNINNQKSKVALSSLLKPEIPVSVQISAIEALLKLKDRESIPSMVKLYNETPHERVKKALLKAIAEIEAPNSTILIAKK